MIAVEDGLLEMVQLLQTPGWARYRKRLAVQEAQLQQQFLNLENTPQHDLALKGQLRALREVVQFEKDVLDSFKQYNNSRVPL